MTNYHSRAAALLNGDYADRTVDITSGTFNIPNPLGNTLAWTYTVGANMVARLEHSFLLCDATPAVNQEQLNIQSNRGGGVVQIDQLFSAVGGAVQTRGLHHDILLYAADTIQAFYSNADAAAVHLARLDILVREIDL